MLLLTHHLISRVVVFVSSDIAAVAESNVLSGVFSEVEDDLPPLSIRDIKLVCVDRVESHARIRSKNRHGNLSAYSIAGLEVELIRPADTGVKEAETVLARFDHMEGPRNAIDLDDISKHAGLLVVGFGIPETAIRIVTFGSKSERQIVLAGR
jgi:hypothetical protein